MNDRRKRGGFSKISLQLPPNIVAEIDIKAALSEKDRETYLIELAQADVSFGAVTRTDHDGVVVMDRFGHIRWVNISFCAMCGYTLVDLFGKRLDAILRGPATEAHSLHGFANALEEKQKHLGPVLNYHKNRRPYWACRLLNPVDDSGHHLGFVALERQISTPASLVPGGHVARQLEARLPHVEKVVRANPGQFGMKH